MNNFIIENKDLLKTIRKIRNQLLKETDKYFLIDFPIAYEKQYFDYYDLNVFSCDFSYLFSFFLSFDALYNILIFLLIYYINLFLNHNDKYKR